MGAFLDSKTTQFRDAGGRRRPVEHRKLVKSYVDFIKASQHFYRIHIQRLCAKYGGIKELDDVAHRCRMSSTFPLALLLRFSLPTGYEGRHLDSRFYFISLLCFDEARLFYIY